MQRKARGRRWPRTIRRRRSGPAALIAARDTATRSAPPPLRHHRARRRAERLLPNLCGGDASHCRRVGCGWRGARRGQPTERGRDAGSLRRAGGSAHRRRRCERSRDARGGRRQSNVVVSRLRRRGHAPLVGYGPACAFTLPMLHPGRSPAPVACTAGSGPTYHSWCHSCWRSTTSYAVSLCPCGLRYASCAARALGIERADAMLHGVCAAVLPRRSSTTAPAAAPTEQCIRTSPASCLRASRP